MRCFAAFVFPRATSGPVRYGPEKRSSCSETFGSCVRRINCAKSRGGGRRVMTLKGVDAVMSAWGLVQVWDKLNPPRCHPGCSKGGKKFRDTVARCELTALRRSLNPEWGSGGRGFESRRPDVLSRSAVSVIADGASCIMSRTALLLHLLLFLVLLPPFLSFASPNVIFNSLLTKVI